MMEKVSATIAEMKQGQEDMVGRVSCDNKDYGSEDVKQYEIELEINELLNL